MNEAYNEFDHIQTRTEAGTEDEQELVLSENGILI